MRVSGVIPLFLSEMVVIDRLTLPAHAHRREPEVGWGQPAGLDGLDGIFQLAKVGIHVVRAEGELQAPSLRHLDDLEAGDLVAGVDL